MDGERIRKYWSNEVAALLETYKQFETLIPSDDAKGAAHRGEDGKFVEALVRMYLKQYLPSTVEVLTGFILRPAVKTNDSGRERSNETDQHSGQLDIIVYDSGNYPIFQRFDDNVVVPPEGVIAIISIKKHLYDSDIKTECLALRTAANLCHCLGTNHKPMRGPFLALVSMESRINKVHTPTSEWIFNQISDAYRTAPTPTFDELVGYIGALAQWSIFKRRPENHTTKKATYIWIEHKETEAHLGLQFILTGIMSTLYDKSRNLRERPGFTAFTSGRSHDLTLGSIEVQGLR